MRKFQAICAALAVVALAAPAFAAVDTNGVVGDDNISMVYDPANGNLSLDSAGKRLTALEVLSAGGRFNATGAKPPVFGGLFDVYTNNKLFKLEPAGFDAFDVPGILPAGMSSDELGADLTLDGAVLPSGNLGNADVAIVPEPSSLTLLGIAALFGLGLRRRRA